MTTPILEISHDHVRQVIEQHLASSTLVKVVETTYKGEPSLSNDTLSVTRYYGAFGDTPPQPLVLVNADLIDWLNEDEIIDLYREHAELCPVHETVIVTTEAIYIATYRKEN